LPHRRTGEEAVFKGKCILSMPFPIVAFNPFH